MESEVWYKGLLVLESVKIIHGVLVQTKYTNLLVVESVQIKFVQRCACTNCTNFYHYLLFLVVIIFLNYTKMHLYKLYGKINTKLSFCRECTISTIGV